MAKDSRTMKESSDLVITFLMRFWDILGGFGGYGWERWVWLLRERIEFAKNIEGLFLSARDDISSFCVSGGQVNRNNSKILPSFDQSEKIEALGSCTNPVHISQHGFKYLNKQKRRLHGHETTLGGKKASVSTKLGE